MSKLFNIGGGDPGLWHLYLNRPEHQNLPLNEVRRRYLLEQADFQQFMMMKAQSSLGVFPRGGVNYPEELKFMYGSVIDDEGTVAYTHVFTLTRGIKYNGVPIYGGNADLGLNIFAWTGNRWVWGNVEDGEAVPTTTERVKEILEDNDFTYTSTPTSKRTPKGIYEVSEVDGDDITRFNHIVLSINDPLPYEIVSL